MPIPQKPISIKISPLSEFFYKVLIIFKAHTLAADIFSPNKAIAIIVQNNALRVVNNTKVMYNALTYEFLRTIFNSILLAKVISFEKGFSQAYILIT